LVSLSQLAPVPWKLTGPKMLGSLDRQGKKTCS